MPEISPHTLSKALPLGKKGTKKKKKRTKGKSSRFLLKKGFSLWAEPILENRAKKNKCEKRTAL